MVRFRTIRQTAADGILNEHRLREMQKFGQLPGFYVGNRFLVDQQALLAQLHQKSEKNADLKS